MAAAVITATSVSKMDMPANLVSGTTSRRYKELEIEGTKATQNDWFLLTSYLSATEVTQIVGIDIVEKASGVVTLGTYTYDAADAKLVLSSVVTGTAYARVRYYE